MPSKQLNLLDMPDLSYAQEQVAGVDEVGRGCLFGPVVAAAVILPAIAAEELVRSGVTDSKQLSATQRSHLSAQIRAVALDYKIGLASVREIDRLNILQASLLAMRRAVLKLQILPVLCLVDGNQKIPHLSMPQVTVVQGDQKSLAIAAASIIAKTWRDALITRLARKYPQYDLQNNKGYGTVKHRSALLEYGPSPCHRLSFSPCQVTHPSNAQQHSKSKIQVVQIEGLFTGIVES